MPVVTYIERYSQIVNLLNKWIVVMGPAGFQKAGISFRIIVMDIYIVFVKSAVIKLDGATVGTITAFGG